MNILITSASRKVGLTRSFQKALAVEGGGRVIAVDVSPTAPALYVADEHFLVPRSDDPSFIPILLALCDDERIDLVVPTRDEELPLLARRRSDFSKVGVRVLVPEPETVDICQDKVRFAEFCTEKGLGTPAVVTPSRQAPFPLFVKPRHGKGGRGTFLVRTFQELQGAMSHLHGDAVVQEYVAAPEFTIDLFADFSGKIISVVPRERIVVVGGESFVSRTVKNASLRDESMRLARELGLTGHNTIQCFLDKSQVKFIEVNPRFGGGAHLGFAAGAPTPEFLIHLLKGEAVKHGIDDFKEGLYMLRYTEDIFLDSDSLTKRLYRS